MPRKPSPRAIARALGQKTYDGDPCKKCGGTRRRTASGNCAPCLSKAVIKWRIDSGWNEATVEQRRESARQWERNNPEKRRAISARYRAKKKALMAYSSVGRAQS